MKLLLLTLFITIAVSYSNECTKYANDEAGCNKDSVCTWCRSAAVRSTCYLISDAEKLPPSIFSCSKVQTYGDNITPLKEKLMKRLRRKYHFEDNECDKYANDEAGCNKDSVCTWCRSAAVRSTCYLISDAKKLPESIFSCSKVSDECVGDWA